MFVSHIAELSDAHLYFTKFRKLLGALPPLEKKSSYATGSMNGCISMQECGMEVIPIDSPQMVVSGSLRLRA